MPPEDASAKFNTTRDGTRVPVPDMQSRLIRLAGVAVIFNYVDFNAWGRVLDGFEARELEGWPCAGSRRKTHAGLEVPLFHTGAVAGGVCRRYETGTPAASGIFARSDNQRPTLEANGPSGPGSANVASPKSPFQGVWAVQRFSLRWREEMLRSWKSPTKTGLKSQRSVGLAALPEVSATSDSAAVASVIGQRLLHYNVSSLVASH